MADIELVIKIPEGLKKDFETEQWTALSCMEMKDVMMNGIQLQKGHGRLIDADALEIDYGGGWNGLYITENKYKQSTIDNAPTIIEADKESEVI